MISKNKLLLWIGTVCINLLFTQAAYSDNTTENYLPYLSGLPNQAKMLAPAKVATATPKTYILPATPATSQWGVFDSSQPPVLTIHSGDTVIIETMAASYNQVVPGTTANQIIQIQTAVANRGPHTVTGPIYIAGAEPGDTLRIHFNKIVPRAYASNNTAPGKGLFPEQFPNPYVKYFYLDLKKMQTQFAPGIVVPLAPFPGVVAVARQTPGKYDTAPPGPFGGNMDLREMTEGTTLYLPVFMKGALLWTGDSHAGQGNGEIDLTAIETAFQEFNITVDVIKNKTLDWPRVETPTSWIAVGYDKDLNKALDIAKTQAIKLLMEQHNISQAQAEQMLYQTWNCPIAEVVNGVQGVYFILPKLANTPAPVLPTADNAKDFVTDGKNPDVEQAMKIASMAMIDKIVSLKKLAPIDAYMLASLTMDCRISPYKTGDKEVHCMMAKNLWVPLKS